MVLCSWQSLDVDATQYIKTTLKGKCYWCFRKGVPKFNIPKPKWASTQANLSVFRLKDLSIGEMVGA